MWRNTDYTEYKNVFTVIKKYCDFKWLQSDKVLMYPPPCKQQAGFSDIASFEHTDNEAHITALMTSHLIYSQTYKVFTFNVVYKTVSLPVNQLSA